MDSILLKFIQRHEFLLSQVDEKDALTYFDVLDKVDELSKTLRNDFCEQLEQALGHGFIKEYRRLIDIAQECVVNGFYFKLENGKMILFGPENYASIHELIPAKNIASAISIDSFTEEQEKLAILCLSDKNSIYLINFAIALTQDALSD